jgi:hypothetical protein
MKKIWNYIMDVADGIARARAATHFSRMGRHDLAKQIMLKDDVRV